MPANLQEHQGSLQEETVGGEDAIVSGVESSDLSFEHATGDISFKMI
jgi:hypothetical protein